jgi:hypothetical protein
LADNSWAGTLSREAMVTIPNLPSPSWNIFTAWKVVSKPMALDEQHAAKEQSLSCSPDRYPLVIHCLYLFVVPTYR